MSLEGTRNRLGSTSRSQRDRDAIAPRSPTNRSAVTNGKRLFVEGDGRSPWSRRYYDLVAAHVADMGGRENLSEGQLALVKRSSTLQVELEQMEGRLSLGEPVDLDVYQRCSNSLRRLLESLGLHQGRKAREVHEIDDEVMRVYEQELHRE
jgi:hypothetical protein